MGYWPKPPVRRTWGASPVSAMSPAVRPCVRAFSCSEPGNGRQPCSGSGRDVVLATIGTGVVIGAAVALLAELFGDPATVLVGVLAGVAAGVATLFVAGAVVSVRRR